MPDGIADRTGHRGEPLDGAAREARGGMVSQRDSLKALRREHGRSGARESDAQEDERSEAFDQGDTDSKGHASSIDALSNFRPIEMAPIGAKKMDRTTWCGPSIVQSDQRITGCTV